jgi:hypothetical protein
MLEAENWKIAVKVYAGDPVSALLLAYQLTAIKQAIQRGRKGIPEAIEGLDMALESLFPHTDFHRMGHKFYYRTIEGALSPKHEAKLRELGVEL